MPDSRGFASSTMGKRCPVPEQANWSAPETDVTAGETAPSKTETQVTDSNTTRTGGIGLSGALFILFVALRLTDHIDWAWYWVAAPLWMPLALVLSAVAIGWPLMVLIDWAVLDRLARRRRDRANAAWRAKYGKGN